VTNDLLSFSLRHDINFDDITLKEKIFKEESLHIYDCE